MQAVFCAGNKIASSRETGFLIKFTKQMKIPAANRESFGTRIIFLMKTVPLVHMNRSVE